MLQVDFIPQCMSQVTEYKLVFTEGVKYKGSCYFSHPQSFNNFSLSHSKFAYSVTTRAGLINVRLVITS